ncbi:MAG: single-stranded-DNA-specific exonuclease RecJ, partial [Gemmatimonadales bacterium]|nr:single-stranded-DNA-specific exonuclease RecJ [Gemmatimonadales bacterium]
LGLDVVVTDHHRPGDELPDAVVLNPWRADCPYPFKDLAGVGVSFKLVSALARRRALPEGQELRFLDLVCLGTVADVVPLLGENRLLVHHGLRRLPKTR